MSEVTVKRIDELGYYQGPHAIPGMKFRDAAKELGVSAWGMNVIEIDAGCGAYPEHDHEKDGQEEVYLVLRGSATVQAGGEEHALEEAAMIREAIHALALAGLERSTAGAFRIYPIPAAPTAMSK